jgi:hypothetical protein
MAPFPPASGSAGEPLNPGPGRGKVDAPPHGLRVCIHQFGCDLTLSCARAQGVGRPEQKDQAGCPGLLLVKLGCETAALPVSSQLSEHSELRFEIREASQLVVEANRAVSHRPGEDIEPDAPQPVGE